MNWFFWSISSLDLPQTSALNSSTARSDCVEGRKEANSRTTEKIKPSRISGNIMVDFLSIIEYSRVGFDSNHSKINQNLEISSLYKSLTKRRAFSLLCCPSLVDMMHSYTLRGMSRPVRNFSSAHELDLQKTVDILKEYILVRRAGEIITSSTNGRLKLLKSLTSKKSRDRTGLVRLDGHRVIIDALNKGYDPQQIVVSERALTAPLGNELLRAVASSLSQHISAIPGMPAQNDADDQNRSDLRHAFRISLASDSALKDALADVSTHQGVTACFAQPVWPAVTPRSDQPELVTVLDGVRHPGNVGTIIRAAVGLGCTSVQVSEDTADVWSPRALRASAGAALDIPVTSMEWDSATTADFFRNKQVVLADSDGSGDGDACTPYWDVDYRLPTVVVIGGEAFGGSTGARAAATRRVRIDMAKSLDSLNAATAAAVILGEAARQRAVAR